MSLLLERRLAAASASDSSETAIDLVGPLRWLAILMRCTYAELSRHLGLDSHLVARWGSLEPSDQTTPSPVTYLSPIRDGWSMAGATIIDDHTLQLHFQVPSSHGWLLTLRRAPSQDSFTFEDSQTAARLAEPFESLITMSSRLDEVQYRAASFQAFLELLDCGVILVDATATISFVNRRGEAMLAGNAGLVRAHGRVSATAFRDATLLQAAINYAFQTGGSDKEEDGRPAPLIAISRPNAPALTVAVVPLHPANAPVSASMVALYVIDPACDMSNAIAMLCSMHGLSRTETRLATLLVSGSTLNDAAQEIRIREQTARAYLRHIFAKLDVGRQADLVRILLTGAVRLRARLVSIAS